MRSIRFALVALGFALAPTLVAAAPILGHATTVSGTTFFEGLGDLGDGAADGRGAGFYSLGTCGFAAGFTTCRVTGSYVEDAGSQNPGATGTFEFRTVWSGAGTSPIIARSTTAGGNTIQLFTLNGGFFELDLLPTSGGSFHGVFPASPFSDSVLWSSLGGAGATCTGSPSACSVGQVLLTAGATISGPTASFSFNLPQPVAEPSAALLLLPLAAAFARRRMR